MQTYNEKKQTEIKTINKNKNVKSDNKKPIEIVL